LVFHIVLSDNSLVSQDKNMISLKNMISCSATRLIASGMA